MADMPHGFIPWGFFLRQSYTLGRLCERLSSGTVREMYFRNEKEFKNAVTDLIHKKAIIAYCFIC